MTAPVHRLLRLLLLGALPLGALPLGALVQTEGRRSGLDFMSPALQALQRDDHQNPAMLILPDGQALWRSRAGRADKACADCHGEASAWAAR